MVIDTSIARNCRHGDIRLVGGATQTEGEVDICVNDIWYKMCASSLSYEIATVVCNSLGFPSQSIYIYIYMLCIVDCNIYYQELVSLSFLVTDLQFHCLMDILHVLGMSPHCFSVGFSQVDATFNN